MDQITTTTEEEETPITHPIKCPQVMTTLQINHQKVHLTQTNVDWLGRGAHVVFAMTKPWIQIPAIFDLDLSSSFITFIYRTTPTVQKDSYLTDLQKLIHIQDDQNIQLKGSLKSKGWQEYLVPSFLQPYHIFQGTKDQLTLLLP